jgi:superfamily I DNA and/or RNA helicase
MTDEIAGIVSRYFYQGRLLNGKEHNSVPGSVVWADYTTSAKWPLDYGDSEWKHSPYNLDEIEVVKEILKIEAHVLEESSRKRHVSVISPYKGQKSKLNRMLYGKDSEMEEIKKKVSVKIDTVDSIQGRDSEVVIFCITRNQFVSL